MSSIVIRENSSSPQNQVTFVVCFQYFGEIKFLSNKSNFSQPRKSDIWNQGPGFTKGLWLIASFLNTCFSIELRINRNPLWNGAQMYTFHTRGNILAFYDLNYSTRFNKIWGRKGAQGIYRTDTAPFQPPWSFPIFFPKFGPVRGVLSRMGEAGGGGYVT